jgi:hypothetical protein
MQLAGEAPAGLAPSHRERCSRALAHLCTKRFTVKGDIDDEQPGRAASKVLGEPRRSIAGEDDREPASRADHSSHPVLSTSERPSARAKRQSVAHGQGVRRADLVQQSARLDVSCS